MGLVPGRGIVGDGEGPVVPDRDDELLEAGEEVGERDGEVLVGYCAGGVGLESVGAGEDVEDDLIAVSRRPFIDPRMGACILPGRNGSG